MCDSEADKKAVTATDASALTNRGELPRGEISELPDASEPHAASDDAPHAARNVPPVEALGL